MKTLLGVITKPQGIKGEMRVRPEDWDIDFKKLESVEIKNLSCKVEKVIIREGFIILKVDEVNDRNYAETLRNIPVYFDAPETENRAISRADFIGCIVYSKQRKSVIGEVVEVNGFGAADVFTVSTQTGEFMFPYARDVITDIDIQNKKIFVDEYILDEIKC